MTENQQQTREQTPDEQFRMLFDRTAKLNDAVSALLAPKWGSENGIIPSDHPLYLGEEARTTPDNGAASGDAADNPLREQYAAAIHADAERPRDERVGIINAVLAVRDAELERLRQQLDFASEAAKEGRSALTAAEQQRDQLAAATLIRDQSALAQIRLHIAAHRPRLQYADPILLAKVEAVLRQVGELEAAGGGEQP
ncbi:hypothetical protein [Streptomyces mirabilis]|uniref:hypothetical protein n=1 Tax=Streptomyces mirabilis TaxID=68239 RepID=UPI0033E0E3F7